MIYVFIIMALISCVLILKHFTKSTSCLKTNDYKYDDLEPYNLDKDDYYAFFSVLKRRNPEPTILTIYKDEIGNPHFAINYIDSGKYQIGKIFNESFDKSLILSNTSDNLYFDWVYQNTEGISENAKVYLYRNSVKKRNDFMCKIDRVDKTHIGFTGYQLTKEEIAGAPMKYRIYSINFIS